MNGLMLGKCDRSKGAGGGRMVGGQEGRRRKGLRGGGAGGNTDCFAKHHTMDNHIATDYKRNAVNKVYEVNAVKEVNG